MFLFKNVFIKFIYSKYNYAKDKSDSAGYVKNKYDFTYGGKFDFLKPIVSEYMCVYLIFKC